MGKEGREAGGSGEECSGWAQGPRVPIAVWSNGRGWCWGELGDRFGVKAGSGAEGSEENIGQAGSVGCGAGFAGGGKPKEG